MKKNIKWDIMDSDVNTSKIIDEYLEQSISCIQKMKKSRQNIERLCQIIIRARENKKKIFLIGNGGSASTASHFVCDLNKTSVMANKNRIRSICLMDNISTISAYGNDFSYDLIFVEQLKNFFDPGDILIAISGSGKSKNIIKAISYAKKKNGLVIGLTGYDGGILKTKCDECLIIPSHSMYRIEDMHLMVNHILTSVLREGTEYK